MEIVELAQIGDEHAVIALENYLNRLAKLGQAINMLDPDVIVLGAE